MVDKNAKGGPWPNAPLNTQLRQKCFNKFNVLDILKFYWFQRISVPGRGAQIQKWGGANTNGFKDEPVCCFIRQKVKVRSGSDDPCGAAALASMHWFDFIFYHFCLYILFKIMATPLFAINSKVMTVNWVQGSHTNQLFNFCKLMRFIRTSKGYHIWEGYHIPENMISVSTIFHILWYYDRLRNTSSAGSNVFVANHNTISTGSNIT